jgi:alpha-tubulin suppressor-like RCC1 family protein
MRELVRLGMLLACAATGASDALAGTATKVAAGPGHTCAVTTGGGVVCWGSNNNGQLGDGTTTNRSTPTVVTGLESGVAAIAGGGNHTCALTTGGGVVCWGTNVFGQLGDGTTAQRLTPTAVSGLSSGVAAIAAGYSHSCALTTGGAVCWGSNSAGQLGDGTATNRATPTAVIGLSGGVAAIAANYQHTCAVTTGGGAVCWGSNGTGQLGDGTTTDRSTPTAVSGLSSGVATLAAGWFHTCAAATGGGMWCWGANWSGQLGDGTTTNQSTPVAVTGLSTGVAVIALGISHTCALTAGGGVVCWGQNAQGELGDGTTTDRLTPTVVSGLSNGTAALAAGQGHTCAVMTGGGVVCWGGGGKGQLGDGTTTRRTMPMAVNGLSSGVAEVAAGQNHLCALTEGGGVLCWGNNGGGRLGDGTMTNRATPTAVIGLSGGVAAIATGREHTCALTEGGGVLCWGNNGYGQLGDGTTAGRFTPTAVSGLSSGVASVVAGDRHTCAVTQDGVVCWGYNANGQLGDGTTTNRSTPTAVTGLSIGVAAVSAGWYHTCALTSSGGVVCWGWNARGQLGDGTTTDHLTPTAVSGLSSGVAAIAAGAMHTCALTGDGGVACWGYNDEGELGDGTTTDRLTPTGVSGLSSGVAALVAAGDPGRSSSHTCALTNGGGVVCWGGNNEGQLGDGTTTDRWTPTAVSGLSSGVAELAAGYQNTCVITASGSAMCWGDDSSGQLGLGRRMYATPPRDVYGFGGAIAVGTTTPAHGSAGGGTAVTIAGAYLLPGATVAIGGVLATGVSVVDTETLTATTGAHAPGTVDVVVHNPDGTEATLAGGFLYTGTGLDFTGDLTADILWRHGTQGDLWLWPMNDAAKMSETYVRTVADTDWEIRGQGDQNGDGTADILWRNKTNGMIYYWPMSAGTPTAETYVATVDTAYDIIGTGDFNGDGRSDILWRNPTAGDVWIWLMDGATVESEVYVDTVDPGYLIKGVGDLDGDGKADLVWHGTAGDVWVWLMYGTTRLSQTYVGTVPDAHYQIQQVADFDGNGKSDLLWWNNVQGDVWIWPMNGAAVVSESYVGTVQDTDYRIVGAGDYDGDTKADILWWNVAAGDVWIWLMNATTKLSENYIGTVPDTGYQVVR